MRVRIVTTAEVSDEARRGLSRLLRGERGDGAEDSITPEGEARHAAVSLDLEVFGAAAIAKRIRELEVVEIRSGMEEARQRLLDLEGGEEPEESR